MLITRSNRLPGTGCSTGGPSMATRIAGVWLTMMRGGSLFTGKVTGFTAPEAAREASRRSRAMVRCGGAILACNAAT